MSYIYMVSTEIKLIAIYQIRFSSNDGATRREEDTSLRKEKKKTRFIVVKTKLVYSYRPSLRDTLKLPEKSIARSRCVSKLWLSITTDPYFITSFETRFRPEQNLLVFFKRMGKFIVFSFPQRERNLNGQSYSSYSSQHVDRYQIEHPKSICFTSMESVHGLVCLRNKTKPIIWNPSMRQFLTLPKPEKSWKPGIRVFLGYDPIEGKHKIVCMPSDAISCEECMVLTLGSSSWRRIKINHEPGFYASGRCINGVLYYTAFLKSGKRVVMSFDVRSETFQPIGVLRLDYWDLLIAYEGRLAVVYTFKEKGIKMLVLEDAEKGEWSEKSFRPSVNHYDSSLKMNFKLSGGTDGGELIYLPPTFVKSFAMLYYDPKRDSFRKVVFEGIADDEFRLMNGLGNSRFHALQASLNHINTPITW